MRTAFGSSAAKRWMKARTDGSKPCRYGISAVSVELSAYPTGVPARSMPIAHRRDKHNRANDAEAADGGLFERKHVVDEQPRRKWHDDFLPTMARTPKPPDSGLTPVRIMNREGCFAR